MKLLGFLLLATSASAQQPWQQLQNPTAAQVLAGWKTPPPEYGPEPYYGLGGPVTLEVVRHDLDNMQRLGFGAVTVQYGFGLPFGYLSPEYFAFFKSFVAEAKQRNLRVWIVDDAGYPSGFAGGKFTTGHPELRMQALVARKLSASDFDFAVSPNFVVATATSTTGKTVTILPVGGRVRWASPGGTWEITLVTHEFRTSPTRSDTNPKRVKDGSQSLENYLDPAATRQYLAYTHEAYKAAVGDEFGKTILGFRGDEPDYSLAGLPWTPAFFASFERQKGYDIRPYLAAMLQPKEVALTAEQLRAKADYYDVFANLFRDGFFKPQGAWCATNHLEYQVHLNHEEMELQLAHSEGDFFRDMRYVQVPGIDSIWHQIWTDTVSDFPRLASSAAHVYGHPRAFTESFAAYRPEPDITMARYVINEQLVRGINLVETMYYPASSTPGRMPSAYLRDPGFPALAAYTRRISYLMSQGRPGASVALLLPASSLWMGSTAADDTFVSTERLLSEHQIDFDIIPEDFLAEGTGPLKTASGNTYTTVLVPHVEAMTEAALDRLKSFAATAGNHVLFTGGTPSIIAGKTYRDARLATPQDFAFAQISTAQLAPTATPPAQPPASAPEPQAVPATLLRALQEAVPRNQLALATPDTALRYTHRVIKGATVFLLFNESANPINNAVVLHGPGSTVERWDPITGLAAKEQTSAQGGGLKVPLELPPYTTEVLVVR
jgi:hypothetical protein